jgi:hypothetical protein
MILGFNIEQNEEMMDKLQQIFPDIASYNYDSQTEIYSIYDSNRRLIGYAFAATGQGYHDKIDILVGLKDRKQ